MRIVSTIKINNAVHLLDIDKFANDDIWYIYDVVGGQELTDRIRRWGTPKDIICDSLDYANFEGDFNFYHVNLSLELFARFLTAENMIMPKDLVTLSAANTMINKKRPNRFVLAKMIEIYDLDVDYTYNGVWRNFDINQMPEFEYQINTYGLSLEEYTQLLSPIKLEPSWFDCPGDEILPEICVQSYNCAYDYQWNHALKDKFCNSAVALITETVWNSNQMNFSEKTLLAMLGRNFPIWIGGKNQADLWASYGFDTFDDIIDHSYQYRDSYFERCWLAVKLNLDLLKNFDRLKILRQQLLPRLNKNRHLVNELRFRQINDQKIEKFPDHIKSAIKHAILQVYR